METQHTPGPWEIRPAQNQNRDYEFDIRPDSETRCQYFNGYRAIATVKHDKRLNKEEAIANVHLIAAAPDLLEALQEMMVLAFDWHPSHLKKANEAVAKATNKQEAIADENIPPPKASEFLLKQKPE